MKSPPTLSQPTRRGPLFLSLSLAITASLFASERPLHAQDSAAERVLFESANRERVSRGLPALAWDSSIAGAARKHAALMAEQHAISHQFSREPGLEARVAATGARFSSVAENVAVGPTADSIHDGWMHSPPHRANLLDPRLNTVGIAVVARGDSLYAVQDFSRSVAVLSFEQQESRAAAQLKARGLALLDETAAARRICVSGSPSPAGHHSVFLLRYTTEDPGKLPDPLEQKIGAHRFTAAAVGACAPPPEGGFSSYKLAVLLYD